MKKLLGSDKDWEMAHTLPSRAKWTQLGEDQLDVLPADNRRALRTKSNQKKPNPQNEKHLHSTTSFIPGSTSGLTL